MTASGPVTPTSDNAREQPGAVEGQERADTRDCAQDDGQRKRIATLTARAALIGLRLSPGERGEWSLTYAAFGTEGHVCTVASLQAAEAKVWAFEQVRAETVALMRGVFHE